MVKIEDVDFEDLINNLKVIEEQNGCLYVSADDLCRYLDEDGSTVSDWDEKTLTVMHTLNELGYYFVS